MDCGFVFLSEHSQCVRVNFNIILLVRHKVIAFLHFCLLCILLVARVGMRKVTLLSMRMIQWLIQSSPWTGSGMWSCSGGFCDINFLFSWMLIKQRKWWLTLGGLHLVLWWQQLKVWTLKLLILINTWVWWLTISWNFNPMFWLLVKGFDKDCSFLGN